MSGVTDIKLSGIFFRKFQTKFDRMAHIGNIISTDYNVVAVTAPAFGVSWKFNGQDFCIGCFYCVIDGSDLTGCTGSGAEKTECVVFRADVHFFQ